MWQAKSVIAFACDSFVGAVCCCESALLCFTFWVISDEKQGNVNSREQEKAAAGVWDPRLETETRHPRPEEFLAKWAAGGHVTSASPLSAPE